MKIYNHKTALKKIPQYQKEWILDQILKELNGKIVEEKQKIEIKKPNNWFNWFKIK